MQGMLDATGNQGGLVGQGSILEQLIQMLQGQMQSQGSNYETFTGQSPADAMVQGAQNFNAPQQPMQPQGAPMPQQDPMMQEMILKLMEEAESMGITDPGEVADYAAAMMQMRGQTPQQ